MSEELDRETALRGLAWISGGVAALAGIALYVQFVFLDLSVTGRAVTFAAATVVALVLAATLPVREEAGLLAALGLVLFTGFTGIAFELSPQVTAVLVVVALAVLFTLVVAIQNNRLVMRPRTGAVALLVVLAALGGVAAADMQPNELRYSASVADAVTNVSADAESTQEVTVGAVTARNPGEYFRERAEYPDARACVYTGSGDPFERGIDYRYDSGFSYDTVSPGSTTTAEMTLLLGPAEVASVDGPIPVERATSCPDSASSPRIVVVVGNATG